MPKNTNKNNPLNILPIALERFKDVTGIPYKLMPGKVREDARIELKTPDGKAILVAEVKPVFIEEVITQHFAAKRDTTILVTNFVNPKQAARFREKGVQFIDCAGNAYIHTKGILVFVYGNKPVQTFVNKSMRMFSPGGLQIIFALLSNPILVNAPYREIATKAMVALGTVAGVMEDMQKQGYVITVGKNRRLVRKKDLLNKWLVGYENVLRPKLMVQKYHTVNNHWWHTAILETGVWGGEVAAEKMTGYIKPGRVTIYAPQLPDNFIVQQKLRIDPHGDIEVLRPFWNFEYPEQKDTLAPPSLVYADLILTGEGRTTETAGKIYEHYLAGHFGEN